MPKGKANLKKSNIDIDKLLIGIERQLEVGSYDVAKVTLEDAIQKVSVPHLAYALLGRINGAVNKFTEGLHAFEKAYVKYSKDPEILFHYGCFLIAAARYPLETDPNKKYLEAANQFNRCLEFNAAHWKALLMLGIANAGLGNYQESKQFIEIAFEQASKNAIPLGFFYFERAMSMLDTARKKSKEITLEEYQNILNDLNQAVLADPKNLKYQRERDSISLIIKTLTKKRVSADEEANLRERVVSDVPAAAKKLRPEVKREEKKPEESILAASPIPIPKMHLYYPPTPSPSQSPSPDLDPDLSIPLPAAPKGNLVASDSPLKRTALERQSGYSSSLRKDRVITTTFKGEAAKRLRALTSEGSADRKDNQDTQTEPPAYQKLSATPTPPPAEAPRVETPLESELERADAICKHRLQ